MKTLNLARSQQKVDTASVQSSNEHTDLNNHPLVFVKVKKRFRITSRVTHQK